MNPDSIERLKNRFKIWAVETIKFARNLPRDEEYMILRKQMIRSASGGAANYRAACRSKSDRDFINKLKIVEEEIDETMFWIEMIDMLRDEERYKNESVYREANELLSITIASIITTRKRLARLPS
ncbi:MAG: four helix bundle protein [Saprospiraceae bacterium]|nr:four helix bundle protein [Saprospiraceae bacterium]